MLQEPSALALFRVEPIDGAAFIGEYLFQIPYGKRLGRSRARFIRKTPDGVYVVMFGDSLEELRAVPRDYVDSTVRQIAGVEDLVKISDDERIRFRRNYDCSIARGQNRQH